MYEIGVFLKFCSKVKVKVKVIPIRSWVDPRAIVRSEGFYVNEKSTDTSWDRASELPICSTAH